jgi:hypothetical protein
MWLFHHSTSAVFLISAILQGHRTYERATETEKGSSATSRASKFIPTAAAILLTQSLITVAVFCTTQVLAQYSYCLFIYQVFGFPQYYKSLPFVVICLVFLSRMQV